MAERGGGFLDRMVGRVVESLLRGGGSGRVDLGWGDRAESRTTVNRTFSYKKVVTIVKGGQSQTVETGVGDADLARLAGELGLPAEALQDLPAEAVRGLMGASGVADGEALEQGSSQHERMSQPVAATPVVCAACQGRTAGRSTCQWCGAALPAVESAAARQEGTAVQEPADAVDEKFLSRDIQPQAAERPVQPLRQSFLQRLQGIDPDEAQK